MQVRRGKKICFGVNFGCDFSWRPILGFSSGFGFEVHSFMVFELSFQNLKTSSSGTS
jgi:hypothetical protein